MKWEMGDFKKKIGNIISSPWTEEHFRAIIKRISLKSIVVGLEDRQRWNFQTKDIVETVETEEECLFPESRHVYMSLIHMFI